MSGNSNFSILPVDKEEKVDVETFVSESVPIGVFVWEIITYASTGCVILISFTLYLILLRVVARDRRKNTPIYFFIFFLYFLSLVEHTDFMANFFIDYILQIPNKTNVLCLFLIYITYGNPILQATTILSTLFYALLIVEKKSYRFDAKAKKYYFPFIIAFLLLLELFLCLDPMTNVKASVDKHNCVVHVPQNASSTSYNHVLLYYILLPYIFPLLLAMAPAFRLISRFNKAALLEGSTPWLASRLALAMSAAFFFFHFFSLIFFTIIFVCFYIASPIYRIVWRARPFFHFLTSFWHIFIPLSPFYLDPDVASSQDNLISPLLKSIVIKPFGLPTNQACGNNVDLTVSVETRVITDGSIEINNPMTSHDETRGNINLT